MVCGIQDETLVGHHIRSWGSSGDDSLGNMITLCARCHDNAGRGYIDRGVADYRMRRLVGSGTGKVWNCNEVFRATLRV